MMNAEAFDPEQLRDALQAMAEIDIPDADKTKIFEANARKVFRITAG